MGEGGGGLAPELDVPRAREELSPSTPPPSLRGMGRGPPSLREPAFFPSSVLAIVFAVSCMLLLSQHEFEPEVDVRLHTFEPHPTKERWLEAGPSEASLCQDPRPCAEASLLKPTGATNGRADSLRRAGAA